MDILIMYIGVKNLISELKPKFDSVGKATKMAKKVILARGEKADKETLELERDIILEEWRLKTKRGSDIQAKLCIKELKDNPNAIQEDWIDVQNTGSKVEKADCKLQNNKTYLEKRLVSNKYGIIGHADKIYVSRGTINIIDNKVWDKIYRTSSYKTDTGFQIIGEKMFEPLDHLDACNYHDAVLQLSLYMYLAWENNKSLKIGSLYIRHIRMNDNNKKVFDTLIKVPYMKAEVKKILKYRLLNNED